MTRTADKKELKVMSALEKRAYVWKNWNIPVTGALFEEELAIASLIAI